MNLVSSGCWKNFNLMSRKSDSKSRLKDAVKSDSKTGSKTSSKSDSKSGSKTDSKTDSKTGSKTGSKTALSSKRISKTEADGRPTITGEEASLERMFKYFDKNADGFIQEEELMEMMKCLGETISRDEAKLMIKEGDTNNDGKIDLKEFKDLLARTPPTNNTPMHLKEAFKVFDRDGDGFISFDEMKFTMNLIGEILTDEQYVKMFKAADADGDGKISLQEFAKVTKRKK